MSEEDRWLVFRVAIIVVAFAWIVGAMGILGDYHLSARLDRIEAAIAKEAKP